MSNNREAALTYARDVLCFEDPVAYGSQVDRVLPGASAHWICERGARPFSRKSDRGVGLVLNAGVVLDEFYPRVDGEPGTLKSS